MKKIILAMIVILGILSAGCISNGDNGGDTPVVELVYMSGCGNMPSALSNDLIDAYIAWQPNVAIAEVAEIGKVISYSRDLPPEGKWHDHPCCVINVSEGFAEENYDVAKYLTMLLILASDYTQENPEMAAQAAAQWIFANQDLTFGDKVVNSLDIERASLPTINFTTIPSQEWKDGLYTFVNSLEEIEMIDNELKGKTNEELEDILLHDSLYEDAMMSLSSGDYLDSTPDVDGVVNVNLGYLAKDDHDTALFVAAYEWEYFRDEFGIYFEPINIGPLGTYDLVVNGTTVARVKALEFNGGSAEMTALSQGNVDFGLAGAPPVILFMDQGAPVKIICPLMTEGSGVVASLDATYDDWDGFVDFIKDSYENGKTIKIGVPMLGSIQDLSLIHI